MVRPAGDELTDSDAWSGGFYELDLLLGQSDVPDADLRLGDALRALWSHRSISGPVAEPSWDAESVVPDDIERVDRYGVATLPNGQQVACRSITVRDRDHRTDELLFVLPAEALDRVGIDAMAGPGDSGRQLVDDWLVDVATTVFAAVPFERACIGFELDVDLGEARLDDAPGHAHYGVGSPKDGVRDRAHDTVQGNEVMVTVLRPGSEGLLRQELTP